ncbi:trypsin-like peptidase domain-containing protein [Candidatus Dependentiae bacterium]|nr:trypsin-like peptidase domain-containing protein [Candidatus Dependentiae bacterium]
MTSYFLQGFLWISQLWGGGPNEISNWTKVEQRVHNSIMRIRCHSAEFDWLEPYRAPRSVSGTGTGFIVDSEGGLITNYHVVKDAKSVYVKLPILGEKYLSATVESVCPDLDIALVRLTAESKALVEATCGPLCPLEFGNSDELDSAEPVLAIGYPLGSNIKASIGAVAGRDFFNQSLIHITAPINPGNSGGPLLTREGKVVGVNTSVRRNAQNYNFAVPSNDIITILSDLRTKKFVRRPVMGILVNKATEAHAFSLGNPLPSGVYISHVFKESEEYRVGIREGDMLYEIIINGTSFSIDEDGYATVSWRKNEKIFALELLMRCCTGDTVSLVVYRKGERLIFHSTFDNHSVYPIRTIHCDYEQEEVDFEICAGLVCMQLRRNHIDSFYKGETDEFALFRIRNYVTDKQSTKKVIIVTHVFPGSQAHFSTCFGRGSLLDTVNGEKVSTLSELRSALLKSSQTGALAFSTKDGLVTAFDVHKVVKDEIILSSDFKYTISETMKKLMTQVQAQA